MAFIKKLIWIIIVFFIGAAWIMDDIPSQSLPQEPKQPPSAEEIAESTRFTKTQLYGLALKENLQDPSSVEWSAIYANDDASIVCFKYRARNSFGALVIEHTVITEGQIKTENSDWNKYCHGQELHNLTHVKRAIN